MPLIPTILCGGGGSRLWPAPPQRIVGIKGIETLSLSRSFPVTTHSWEISAKRGISRGLVVK